jgi:hypothetical protein
VDFQPSWLCDPFFRNPINKCVWGAHT